MMKFSKIFKLFRVVNNELVVNPIKSCIGKFTANVVDKTLYIGDAIGNSLVISWTVVHDASGKIVSFSISFYTTLSDRISNFFNNLAVWLNEIFSKAEIPSRSVHEPFTGSLGKFPKYIAEKIKNAITNSLDTNLEKKNPFDFRNYPSPQSIDEGFDEYIFYVGEFFGRVKSSIIGRSVKKVWRLISESPVSVAQWIQIKAYSIQTGILNIGAGIGIRFIANVPVLGPALVNVNPQFGLDQWFNRLGIPPNIQAQAGLFFVFGLTNRFVVDGELKKQGLNWKTYAPDLCKGILSNIFGYFRYYACSPSLDAIQESVIENLINGSPTLREFKEIEDDVSKISYLSDFLDFKKKPISVEMDNPYIWKTYLDEEMTPSRNTWIEVQKKHQMIFEKVYKDNEEIKITQFLQLEWFIYN